MSWGGDSSMVECQPLDWKAGSWETLTSRGIDACFVVPARDCPAAGRGVPVLPENKAKRTRSHPAAQAHHRAQEGAIGTHQSREGLYFSLSPVGACTRFGSKQGLGWCLLKTPAETLSHALRFWLKLVTKQGHCRNLVTSVCSWSRCCLVIICQLIVEFRIVSYRTSTGCLVSTSLDFLTFEIDYFWIYNVFSKSATFCFCNCELCDVFMRRQQNMWCLRRRWVVPCLWRCSLPLLPNNRTYLQVFGHQYIVFFIHFLLTDCVQAGCIIGLSRQAHSSSPPFSE